MKKIETNLKDCYIVYPSKFGDERGYFSEFFVQESFEELGFRGVVQANRSMSSKGVLRGLHFQAEPKTQAKLVEVIKGSAIDVVVDIREGSPSYGDYTAVPLTEDNNKQLFVPRGFAHGFVSLEDNTVFQYFVDNRFAPDYDGGIIWNDPDLCIDWDKILKDNGIIEPNLSDKDQKHPTLKYSKTKFVYRGR